MQKSISGRKITFCSLIVRVIIELRKIYLYFKQCCFGLPNIRRYFYFYRQRVQFSRPAKLCLVHEWKASFVLPSLALCIAPLNSLKLLQQLKIAGALHTQLTSLALWNGMAQRHSTFSAASGTMLKLLGWCSTLTVAGKGPCTHGE